MESIEDCFVKFFLRQAQEIEPDTIQTLIDHDYRTKLSLTAMDLERDLPLIKEISLAQRSLLRRYLAALQESQPFQVTLTKDPPVGTVCYDYQMGIPIKKRKYDVYIADQSFSYSQGNDRDNPENMNRYGMNLSETPSKKVFDSIVQRINKRKSQIGSHASPEMQTNTEQDQQIGTSASTLRVHSPDMIESSTRMAHDFDNMRPSINNHRNAQEQKLSQLTAMEASTVQDSEMIEEQNVSIRSKRGRKSLVSRTPSQLRYEKIRQSIAAINNNSDASVSPEAVGKTRRSKYTAQSKSDSENDEKKQTVMTPAEREILARIEAKKQQVKVNTKSRRRRK